MAKSLVGQTGETIRVGDTLRCASGDLVEVTVIDFADETVSLLCRGKGWTWHCCPRNITAEFRDA